MEIRCEHLEVEHHLGDWFASTVYCRIGMPGCQGCPAFIPEKEDTGASGKTTVVDLDDEPPF